MSTRDTLLTRIEDFLSQTEMSERHFSLAATGDHKFIKRLRSGAGVTLTLIERVEAFMANYREDAA